MSNARRARLRSIGARRWLSGAVLAALSGALVVSQVLRATTHARRPLGAVDAADAAAVGSSIVESLELMTGVRIMSGNRVRLLLDGRGTYPPLLADLAAARRTITMQMYYARPGTLTDSVASILCARARAGVSVRLLLDAFGAVDLPRRWRHEIAACGVRVSLLRPLEWSTIHSATDRSHVRAVVIDGRVGYTGGFGLADYWLGDGHHEGQWRETNVRFEGPAVGGLQAAFAAAWSEATGELLVGQEFFPTDTLDRSRDSAVDAGLLFTAPSTGSTAAERFLALAIQSARRRLYITNSYFVPGEDFRRLLAAAADRGVDVRILTVGANTDVKTPWLAGRTFYDALREHGVRVYEYQPSMMHAKTMVVDDVWSSVGSMNFDNHSLAFNDESVLVVFDRGFAASMDSVFVDDLRYAREMTPALLSGRSWAERAIEQGAKLLSRIL